MAWAEALSFVVHISLPVRVSNARKRESSVEPMKIRPPAVTIAPPVPCRPVLRKPSGKLSVTPNTLCQTILPVAVSTALS